MSDYEVIRPAYQSKNGFRQIAASFAVAMVALLAVTVAILI